MNILSENKPLDVFYHASEKLNNAVEHTLGPNGTNTAVVTKDGFYDIINDGKSIIETLTSLDAEEYPALNTLKQACFETNRKAGDGTTSTVILTHQLLSGARDYLEAHPEISPVELRNILETSRDKVLEYIRLNSKKVSKGKYEDIVKVSLGSSKYANIIVDAFRFLDKGQRPTLVKSDVDSVIGEKTDGLLINKIQVVSNLFLDTQEFKDFEVVCLYEEINRLPEITQFIRLCAKENKPIILLYKEMSVSVLENLLFNFTQGAINIIPVRLGAYGKKTYELMQNISEYTGCSLIDGNDLRISEVNKISFGAVNYGTLDTESLLLKCEKNFKNFSKNSLQMSTKSYIIRIGDSNKVAREEVYRRIEDAVNSLGNAIINGITKGAGYTYKDACKTLDTNTPDFVISALSYIANKLNLQEDDIEKLNIYDAASVSAEVVKNAFTMVAQVITTNRIIHDNLR